jgi:hypothetical protein
MLSSINHRVNLNGREYDIVDEGDRVMLREVNNPNNVREIDRRRLQQLKDQNERVIREMMGSMGRQGINRTGGYSVNANQQEYLRQTEPLKPPSSSYANNLLLLQSKATPNNGSSRQINVNNGSNQYIKTDVRSSDKDIV